MTVALGLSGCAMLDQINKNTQKRNADRRAMALAQQEEEERQEAEEKAEAEALDKRRDAALNIGTKISDFVSAFGKPTNLAVSKNMEVLYYDLGPKSYKFFFEKKALTGWEPDYDRENQRRNARHQAEMERTEQQRLINEADAARSAAWQNLGNQLNHMNTQNKLDRIESNQRQSEYNRK